MHRLVHYICNLLCFNLALGVLAVITVIVLIVVFGVSVDFFFFQDELRGCQPGSYVREYALAVLRRLDELSLCGALIEDPLAFKTIL
jgi:hypothetical protein